MRKLRQWHQKLHSLRGGPESKGQDRNQLRLDKSEMIGEANRDLHHEEEIDVPTDMPKAAAAPTTSGCRTYVFMFFDLTGGGGSREHREDKVRRQRNKHW